MRGARRARHVEELGRFSIPGIDGARVVRVYLPSVYDGAHAAPVLYMFDGQNVFDDAPSFVGGWRAHETVERLSSRRFHHPILVGIHHGGPSRVAELGPWRFRDTDSRADRLLDWMGHSLLPHVASRFHVVRGPVGASVGGSSMGGLAALYAHYRRPDLFGGAIAMSPSLWFAGGAIFRFVGAQTNPWVSRVYLDCGGREGQMARLVEHMGAHLRSRGYGETALKVRIDPKGSHNENAWRRRMLGAMRFMFRR